MTGLQRFPIASKVLDIVGEVIDRRVTDKNANEEAKREIEAKLIDASIAGQLAQIEVNKAEATNSNIFVAGWRPFIGWVCGSALAYQFVLAPVSMWAASWAGFEVPMPPMLDEMLWQLILGMLGMGGLRTFEKLHGVAK